mgnify:CR=1 FL=1
MENMKTPKKKIFKYSIEIEEIPHTQETTEYTLDTDFYNPDFPEDTWAREILGELFKDAIIHRMMMGMKFIPKGNEPDKEQKRMQEMVEWNKKYEERYRKLQDTIKLIKQ